MVHQTLEGVWGYALYMPVGNSDECAPEVMCGKCYATLPAYLLYPLPDFPNILPDAVFRL